MGDIVKRLKDGAVKATVAAGTAGVLSCLLFGGFEPQQFAGVVMPRAVAQSASIFVSTYAADVVLPTVVPWVSIGSPALKRFEMLLLEPALVGLAGVVVDGFLAPGAIAADGGILKSLTVNAGSMIISNYVSSGMSWVKDQ
jgi:uncharacterized protein YodC (DUF2158 family)